MTEKSMAKDGASDTLDPAGDQAPAGLSVGKIVALAVLLVLVLLVGAVFLLGGSSLLPFNYEGF